MKCIEANGLIAIGKLKYEVMLNTSTEQHCWQLETKENFSSSNAETAICSASSIRAGF